MIITEPSLFWRLVNVIAAWCVIGVGGLAAWALFSTPGRTVDEPSAQADDPLWPLPDVRDGVPGVLAERTAPRFRDPSLFCDHFTTERHAHLHAIQGGRR